MPTVLITGASRGIGLGIAKRYSEIGWRVIATCRDPNTAPELQEISRQCNDVSVESLDLSSLKSVHRAREAIRGEPIDVVFNNAGIDINPNISRDQNLIFERYNRKNWLHIMEINAIAPYEFTLDMVNNIELGNKKVVVFLSSEMRSTSLNTNGKYCAYRASKTALNSLVRSLACSLVERGITCAALNPGRIKTQLGGHSATMSVRDLALMIPQFVDQLNLQHSGSFLSVRHEKIDF